jgi:hypothetical protein
MVGFREKRTRIRGKAALVGSGNKRVGPPQSDKKPGLSRETRLCRGEYGSSRTFM